MPDHTFTISATPMIHVNGCSGRLHVDIGDAHHVGVELTEAVDDIRQDNDTVVIDHAHGNVYLRVPAGAIIAADDLQGDAHIRGIAMLTIERAAGSVRIERIGGDIRLRDMRSDVQVDGAHALRIEEDTERPQQWQAHTHEHRNVSVRNVANVDIQQVHGDLVVDTAESVIIGSTGGNVHLTHPGEVVRFGNTGGNLQITGAGRTRVSGDNVGGNARFDALRSVSIGNIGGEGIVHSVQGDVKLMNVSGQCRVDASGPVTLGAVGGSLQLNDSGPVQLTGPIGGSLALHSTVLDPDTGGQIMVGGSARLELPAAPNLTLHAMTGGPVRGLGLRASGGQSMITFVYGDGATQLHLTTGGSLELVGGGTPRVTQSSWGAWSSSDMDRGAADAYAVAHESFDAAWENFGKDFGESFSTAVVAGTEVRAPVATVVSPADREQERLAVLRMIASGRITPAEGEMLLNALG